MIARLLLLVFAGGLGWLGALWGYVRVVDDRGPS